MSEGNPGDRRLILRRRAAFLSSALAVAGGCARAAPAPSEPAQPEPSVVSVPAASADEGEANEAVPEPQAPAKPAEAPPSLETPAGMGETAQQRFKELRERMRGIYALLDAVDVPQSCDVKSSSCDARWRKLAEDLLTLDERSRWIVSPCKGSSADAKLFEARAKEHVDYLDGRRKELTARIDEVLSGGGEAAHKRWKEHQHDVRRNHPQVCLSFGCVDW